MKVWFMPLLVGLISLAGLLIALIADGVADLVSIVMLAIPVLLGIWLGYLKRSSPQEASRRVLHVADHFSKMSSRKQKGEGHEYR
ncbi:MAG: hypothetical protein ACO1N5_09330 [Noviherbaspirillum sp.]